MAKPTKLNSAAMRAPLHGVVTRIWRGHIQSQEWCLAHVKAQEMLATSTEAPLFFFFFFFNFNWRLITLQYYSGFAIH